MDLLLRRRMAALAVEEGTSYSLQPLTFEVLSGGTIEWNCSYKKFICSIQYSRNGGSWHTLTPAVNNPASFSVYSGDIIQFKGDNAAYCSGSYYNQFTVASGATFKAYGNIMSLIDGTNYATLQTLTSERAFSRLFYNCEGLVNASNLVLPAMTLTERCYSGLFENCSNLVLPPKILPAVTLADSCYYSMFSGSGIIRPPKLLGATLALSCYRLMFNGCTSLTTAPELPVTTLTVGCYEQMFGGCTSLERAPVLPATTVVPSCYSYMFYGASSLSYVKAMFTRILPSYYSISSAVEQWCYGVANSGTFVKNSSARWAEYGVVPSGWTVQTASS